jgi:putative acetyltransferase
MRTHAVTLRRATPADVEAIAALFRRVQEATVPFRPDLHTPEEDRAMLGGVIAKDNVWIAEDAGAIIGFIAHRDGFVGHLYVDMGHQGRGIGTKLLEMAMSDHDCLHLWVFQKNIGARRFYERRGFRAIKETDGTGNEEREPDALVEWRRDP